MPRVDARSRRPAPSRSLQLAKSAQERKVQSGAHRLRPERPRECHIGFELRPISLHFSLQESSGLTTFVPAGLEIDHPPRTFAVDERAIDHRVGQSPARDAGQGELAARLAVLRRENPLPPRIAERAHHGINDDTRGVLELFIRNSLAMQQLTVQWPGFDNGVARRQFMQLREPLQHSVHHRADMAHRLAGPAEFQPPQRSTDDGQAFDFGSGQQ